MAQVTFYLKNPNAKNKSVIYADFSFDSKRLQTSTKWSIHPKYWDKKRGSLKHQYSHLPFYLTYKEYLDKFRTVIIDFYQEQKLIGIIPDLASIKKHLEEEFKEKEEVNIQEEFFTVFQLFIDSCSRKSILTVRKYYTLKNLLKDYRKKKRKLISFDSLDLNFFDDFTNYLFNRPNPKHPDTIGLKDDTVNKYISVFKTFLEWAADREYHENFAYRKFSSPKTRRHEIVTLTNEEIEELVKLDLSEDDRLEKVRDIFLFAYYTGQRWSDIDNFNKNDIKKDVESGEYYWQFRVVKTKKIITIPFVGRIKPAYDILQKYKFNLPEITAQKFNDYLKEVGAKAKLNRRVRIKRYSGSKKITIEKVLYDFMSSHMARRTCVTHLLEDGVPPTTVMKLTDHQDLKTILKYENTSLKALKIALTKSIA
jgi:site-specific recombinase XerD